MKKLLTAFLFLFIISNVKAQDSTSKFSLKQAIDFALTNQVDVKNSLLEEEVSHQKINELKGYGTPQISGSADLNNYLKIPTIFFGDQAITIGSKFTSSVGLSASQILFDGSYLVGLQASKAYQELSRKKTNLTKTETVVNVSKAYYGALISNAYLEQVEANVDRIKKTLDDTRALNTSGFVEKIDADRIELSYNNLLVERDKIKRLKILNFALLEFQMGLPPTSKIELTDKLEDYPLAITALPDSVDYNKRPEFALIEMQHHLQELDLRRYKSNYLPSLKAIGSISANASRDHFTIFDTNKQWYQTSLIGLSLNVPIWDGLQKNSKVQQSKIALLEVDNSTSQLKQSIQLGYISAKSNFDNYIASLETTRKNVELAKEISRQTKIKYDNGIGSSLEVIDSESSLKESNANYFNILFETILAKIDLDKSTGNITY